MDFNSNILGLLGFQTLTIGIPVVTHRKEYDILVQKLSEFGTSTVFLLGEGAILNLDCSALATTVDSHFLCG